MSESPSSQNSRSLYLYYLIGAALGSIVGWMISPTEFRRLGLSIGAATGILVIKMGNRWWLNKRPPEVMAAPLGFVGHAVYSLSMILCLYMMWLFSETWIDHPAKWSDALVGLLFFGAGAVVVFLLWAADSLSISNWLTEARTHVALSICSFIVAIGSGYVITTGNVVGGLAGVVFFGWCGFALLRKAHPPER